MNRTNFKIYAHRGASSEAPDNSAKAFRLAIEQQSDLIETDIRQTIDGELILCHDPNILNYEVSQTRLIDLLNLNSNLLTVSNCLIEFGSLIPFCWELKSVGIGKKLISLVHKNVPPHIWITTEFTSFDLTTAISCQRLAPTNLVGWLTDNWDEKTIMQAHNLGLLQLCPPTKKVLQEPDLISLARNLGLNIRVWEIDDVFNLKMLASLGINGGTVNWPLKARSILAS